MLLGLLACGAGGCKKKPVPPVKPAESPLATMFPAGDHVIDLSHPEIRSFGFGDATNEVKRWQVFMANKYPQMSAVEVRIRTRSYPPASALTVELCAVKNGLPTGSALASNSIVVKQLTTTCVVVRCPLFYDKLKEGEYYAIVLGQTQPNFRCYMWETAKYEQDLPGYEHSFLATTDLTFGKWTGTGWKAEPGCGIGWLRVYLD